MSEASTSTLSKPENSYYQPLDELINNYNTNIKTGIKSSELYERTLKFGYNELPKIKKSLWKIYFAPIFNFLIVILIITGIIVIFLGSPQSTIITFTVVIMNSTTAVVQQFRAQKALKSLQEISALKATVIRDEQETEIFSRDILPGDIVILNQGDKIPADGRIIESMNLTIDEAPLTGESEAVEKNNELIEQNNVSIQKQSNMVFMGTYVDTGRAKMLVTNIGIHTEIGKISEQLNEMGSIEDIPLTRKLNRLGYILGTVVIINLIILIIYKFTLLSLDGKFYGEYISQALVDSILRAMNIMPINLPLLTTLVLITGVLKMAQSGVVIKNLSAIESLGRVSVICSDKTGTITKNEMMIQKFWLNNEIYEVSGTGYNKEGVIFQNDAPTDIGENDTVQKFIGSIILNNNAKLIYDSVKVRVSGMNSKAIRRALGSPTEAALLVLTEKAGYVPLEIKEDHEILMEYSA